ncbi:MAG TPA: carboxypeptidase-like regulatory domain-containing protein [Gemmataceae bacterium]|nr:carboxypeptidase-like regulatory domain-containing protein [Gemmataceae bacterium]
MKRSLLFASTLFGLLVATSCSSDTAKVTGVVTIDGKPVEGATVVFMTEDGNHSYTGSTDASGNFTLVGKNQKENVATGTYKVTVVKSTAPAAGALDPTNMDAMKMMKKETSEAAVGNPQAGKGGPAMPGMPGFKKGGMPGSSGSGPKSDLPAIYATLATTPITVKVPPDKLPVPIELSSSAR